MNGLEKLQEYFRTVKWQIVGAEQISPNSFLCKIKNQFSIPIFVVIAIKQLTPSEFIYNVACADGTQLSPSFQGTYATKKIIDSNWLRLSPSSKAVAQKVAKRGRA